MASMSRKRPACSFTLYTYEYKQGDGFVRMNAFWARYSEVRGAVTRQRASLSKRGTISSLPDIRVLKVETIPVDIKVMTKLLSEDYEDLCFLFHSETVIEVVQASGGS